MPPQAPNAALLIDFDNVTMGIRSDLQGELNNLLSSDIIKGKVAVRRAYADWRRYPQYIVPLTEASIDLIFAPAYGSAKKNATDIRLAIDALELVFTRPEIGTFVLLSGDSDFSSMVIKLKEYGKYVIGVGIRESSSDLLVMNCDEYYSYNALAGLVRTSDEESTRWDAYELVTEAVQRMKRNGDVMRSDRLKQVMQEIDASFDEKNLGMPKFSRFVQEAQSRGLLTVTKLENGQLEIGAPSGTSAAIEAAPSDSAVPAATSEAEESEERGTAQEREERRGRRGRRGRGRDRDRDDRPRAGAAAEGANAADADDAAPTTSERTPSAAAAASDAPLGAVARVSSPAAGDAPLGAVARVSSPAAASAPAAAGTASPADAAPLGAVGRSSGGRDRGPRDNRGDGRGDRGPARERTDTPRQDTPRQDTPRQDTPRTDAPGGDAPRTDAPRAASTDAPDTIGLGGEKLTRAEAFDLVQRAVTSLVSGNATTSAEAVRRKSFELLGRDSETLASRMFERILRDAHDAEVIDLRRRGDDYEVGRVAEAATIAEQLAKKEAELAQVQKDAAKASGTAGPTGLGTRGRVAGRGGSRGGRAGGPPPELSMVGVVKASSSASPSASAASAPAAAASAPATQVAESTPVAVASSEAATEASSSRKSDGRPAKKAAKTAPRTSTKPEAKAGKSATKSAKSAAKTPAKTAARTSANQSETGAAKAPAKTSAKSPAKSAAKKPAKKAAKTPAKKSARKAAKKST